LAEMAPGRIFKKGDLTLEVSADYKLVLKYGADATGFAQVSADFETDRFRNIALSVSSDSDGAKIGLRVDEMPEASAVHETAYSGNDSLILGEAVQGQDFCLAWFKFLAPKLTEKESKTLSIFKGSDVQYIPDVEIPDVDLTDVYSMLKQPQGAVFRLGVAGSDNTSLNKTGGIRDVSGYGRHMSKWLHPTKNTPDLTIGSNDSAGFYIDLENHSDKKLEIKNLPLIAGERTVHISLDVSNHFASWVPIWIQCPDILNIGGNFISLQCRYTGGNIAFKFVRKASYINHELETPYTPYSSLGKPIDVTVTVKAGSSAECEVCLWVNGDKKITFPYEYYTVDNLNTSDPIFVQNGGVRPLRVYDFGVWNRVLSDAECKTLNAIPGTKLSARPQMIDLNEMEARLTADNSVTTPMVTDGAITLPKLGQDVTTAIEQAGIIPDGSITTPKMADGAVTPEKLAQAVLDLISSASGFVKINSITKFKVGEGQESLGVTIKFSNNLMLQFRIYDHGTAIEDYAVFFDPFKDTNYYFAGFFGRYELYHLRQIEKTTSHMKIGTGNTSDKLSTVFWMAIGEYQ